MHDKELHDLNYSHCCVRERGKMEWKRLHDKELHDLNYSHCCVRDRDKMGVEKTA